MSEAAKKQASELLLDIIDLCPCHLSHRDGEEGPWDDWIRESRGRIADALDDERSTAEAEVMRLREALTPSAETKAVYHGEFNLERRYVDEDGQEHTYLESVPWTTIKEIMAAISARAALSPAKEKPDGR